MLSLVFAISFKFSQTSKKVVIINSFCCFLFLNYGKKVGLLRVTRIMLETCIRFFRNEQARSQKFAMGGCFGGLGADPQSPEANGSLGAKPPAARGWGFGGTAPAAGGTGVWGRSHQRSKILHFFAKIT